MLFALVNATVLFACLLQPWSAHAAERREDAQELERFKKADFFGVPGNSVFYQCHDALIKQKWTATVQSLKVEEGGEGIDVVSWHTRPAPSDSKKILVIRMKSYGFINRQKSGQARFSMSNAETQAFGILKSIEEVEALEQVAANAHGPTWIDYARSQKKDFIDFLEAAGFETLGVEVESHPNPVDSSANGFLQVHFFARSQAKELSHIQSFRGVGIRTTHEYDDLAVK